MSAPSPLVDAAKIRRLRLQAGYSTRRLARLLSASASTIRGLEDGTNHEQLPLTFLARLAEQLGVAITELFAHAPTEPVTPAADDRIIEAALRCCPGLVAVSELAAALGWKLARTRGRVE